MTASGSSALIGFYLASLALQGRPIDAALIGFLEVAFNVSALITAVPFGILIDRFSPRFVIVLAAILGAIATQLFGLSGLIGIFFVSRMFEGAASAGGNSGILVHLTDLTSPVPEKRGRVMSGFEITIFGGLALGSLISGPLWDQFNTTAFSMLSACYVVAALLFNWGARQSVRAKKPISDSPWAGVRAAVNDPFLRKLAPAWLAYNTVTGIWISQTVFQLSGPPREGQFLVGLLANNAPLVGLIIFAFTIVTAIGIFIWGRVLTHQPRVKVMRIAITGMFANTFFFFLINASGNWSIGVRIALFACYGLCVLVQSGFTPAALSFLADIAENSKGRGASMGIYTLLLSLGNITGALSGGFLAQWQAFNGMLIATICFATIAILSLSLLPSE